MITQVNYSIYFGHLSFFVVVTVSLSVKSECFFLRLANGNAFLFILLTSHALPDINIARSGLSDPSSSLPATHGISDVGRSLFAAPIAEPRHTQDMEPAEITTTQMMHGPGSSRSDPIFVDSDLEDTFEHPCSTRTHPIYVDSESENSSSDDAPEANTTFDLVATFVAPAKRSRSLGGR